jgi:FtsP/CotA-like multicopper oxidase with cupredoxin domain
MFLRRGGSFGTIKRPDVLNRDGFLRIAGTGVIASGGAATAALAQSQPRADYRLAIARTSLEIAPGHTVSTLAYNGRVPGPLIRVREGARVTIDVTNNAGVEDIVHWHGLGIPADVDGAMEEGSPMVRPGGTRRYSFIARPAGTRWYHSHAFAGQDLTRSLYTGQFGFFVIDPKSEPGRYDQEVFLAVHGWEPSWVLLQDLRKGPPPDNGFEVMYGSASFNGRALGAGEPVRVRAGQRVLFRLLNANATMETTIAFAGHRFRVVALDGNPVAQPQTVDSLPLAPGERIDALVEMNNPGVWIFGGTSAADRAAGMGVVVEYAGASGPPQWRNPSAPTWDLAAFGRAGYAPLPDDEFELTFAKIAGGRGGYNRWTINGKSWPDTDPLLVRRGRLYRIKLRNDSGDMHGIHLHRHLFELTEMDGNPTRGVFKDVLALPARKTAIVLFAADNPGPALLHCHMQDHQDFGFMTLVKYAAQD